MKTCNVCKHVKPFLDFHRCAATKGGLKYTCRTCLSHRKRATGQNRRSGLQRYGLTEDQYQRMVEKQQHVCAICRERRPSKHDGRLVVDHCHVTGHVRGLLCDFCNWGLGNMRDRVDILQRAIQYLEKNGYGHGE
jgi:hypothetical protein